MLPASATAFAVCVSSAGPEIFALRIATSGNFTCRLNGNEIIQGPARDTSRHLFELGFLASITSRFVVDGVGYNGTADTNAVSNNTTTMQIGARQGDFFADFRTPEIVIANDLPSAGEAAAMRQYFRDRPYGLTIA